MRGGGDATLTPARHQGLGDCVQRECEGRAVLRAGGVTFRQAAGCHYWRGECVMDATVFLGLTLRQATYAGAGCTERTFDRAGRPSIRCQPVEPALEIQETAMSIARCLTALLVVALIGGCASVGMGAGREADETPSTGAQDELALLRLAEKVEAAGLGSP